MRERPIIFSSPMVRAILDGSKTQTRRVVSRGNSTLDGSGASAEVWAEFDFGDAWVDPGLGAGPYLKVARPKWETRHRVRSRWEAGDRLWVRETFYCDDYRYPDGPRDELLELMEYRAEHNCANWEAGCPCRDDAGHSSWRSPIHMPRWASRIDLDVTDVRVERLQVITEEDARAEGVIKFPGDHSRRWGFGMTSGSDSPRSAFAFGWDRINGKAHPWSSNPWVWVVSFRRVERIDDEVTCKPKSQGARRRRSTTSSAP